ncbi:hypothetical protein AAC387_Pa07g3164 [Persea americana]
MPSCISMKHLEESRSYADGQDCRPSHTGFQTIPTSHRTSHHRTSTSDSEPLNLELNKIDNRPLGVSMASS